MSRVDKNFSDSQPNLEKPFTILLRISFEEKLVISVKSI
jgi:hypothetical protein